MAANRQRTPEPAEPAGRPIETAYGPVTRSNGRGFASRAAVKLVTVFLGVVGLGLTGLQVGWGMANDLGFFRGLGQGAVSSTAPPEPIASSDPPASPDISVFVQLKNGDAVTDVVCVVASEPWEGSADSNGMIYIPSRFADYEASIRDTKSRRELTSFRLRKSNGQIQRVVVERRLGATPTRAGPR